MQTCNMCHREEKNGGEKKMEVYQFDSEGELWPIMPGRTSAVYEVEIAMSEAELEQAEDKESILYDTAEEQWGRKVEDREACFSFSYREE